MGKPNLFYSDEESSMKSATMNRSLHDNETNSVQTTTHAHTVNPLTTPTNTAGTHNHTVDPGPFNASVIASGGTASINPNAGFSVVSVNVPQTISSDHNGHSHTVDIGLTPTTFVSNLPPYYALAFIVKL